MSFEFKKNVLTTLGKTVIFYLEKYLNEMHVDFSISALAIISFTPFSGA